MRSTKTVYMIKRQVSRNRLQEFNEFNLMSFITKKKQSYKGDGDQKPVGKA